MKWKVTVKGVDKAQKLILNIERGLEDFREPLDDAGIYMHKSIGRNFENEGRPTKWVKHSALTQKLRGSDARILQDSGQLRNSVTSKGSGSKYELSKTKLVIGSNVKARGSNKLLGEIQQLGLPASKHFIFGKPIGKGIPPRPFLMFQNEDERIIQKIFEDYVNKLTR